MNLEEQAKQQILKMPFDANNFVCETCNTIMKKHSRFRHFKMNYCERNLKNPVYKYFSNTVKIENNKFFYCYECKCIFKNVLKSKHLIDFHKN